MKRIEDIKEFEDIDTYYEISKIVDEVFQDRVEVHKHLVTANKEIIILNKRINAIETQLQQKDKEIERLKNKLQQKENIIKEFEILIKNEINESKLEDDYDRADSLEYCLATLRELKKENK